MKAVALKLVLRSWWRNKTFSIISIVSLAIGIACTNLLAAFVIYEFNIEADNPNKEKIVYMAQDSPLKSGEKVSFIVGKIPIQLKEQYSEVEDYLRFGSIDCNSVTIGDKKYDPILITITDTTFARFFEYEVLHGNLHDALASPDKAALSESCARKLFGKTNPVGKIVQIDLADGGIRYEDETTPLSRPFQIAAVLKEHSQSYLKFDMLTGIGQDYYGGGVALLKVSPSFDKEQFAQKIKADGVPTLQQEKGRYYFYTLQESYFQHYTQESIPYIARSQQSLLLIGLISALLILLIAHDLIPVFNRIMSGRITTGFFLNRQVLPVICGLILIMSVIPACYMSRKIANLTDSNYRLFFTGNKKRKVVTALSVMQYIISIGLVIGTLTIHAQLKLTQKKGECYRNLIEIGSWKGGKLDVNTFAAELKNRPEIASVTRAGGSLLFAWLQQIIVENKDGSESYYSSVQYMGEEDLLQTLNLQIHQGLAPREAMQKYDQPVYINRRYADILIPVGENPVGQLVSRYDKSFQNVLAGDPKQACTICGIVSDLYINTLEEEAMPSLIYLNNAGNQHYRTLYVRLNEKQKKEGMETLQAVWKKVNPNEYFTYIDVYEVFMQRNHRTTDMANLLLMYSIISILLTCFGLFGMALYATKQRTKEIGIRKVNGASTRSIMLLLIRQFVKWIAVAFVIATPLAWVLLNRWLESFANRISISPLYFLMGGGIVLAITLLTVGWHSYRAASSNPVKSLKSE